MRKFLFAALAAFICFTSCNDTTTSTTTSTQDETEQKNLEAARKVGKAFETGDVSAIDSVVADDFLDHTDKGDKRGRDSLKAMVNFIHTNFKDMKMETIKEFAEDDYVVQWMRYTGTSDGSMGMPAGPYDMRVMEVSRFQNGKVAEHWAYMDMTEMMKMMGAPQPGANTNTGKATDTTKKKN